MRLKRSSPLKMVETLGLLFASHMQCSPALHAHCKLGSHSAPKR